MTPQQYAEDLLPLTMRLIAAVHDDGPNAIAEAFAAIRALPAPERVDPDDALAVALAAAVDPTRTRGELWGWTNTLTAGPGNLIPTTPTSNPVAVELGITGRLSWIGLTPPERDHVVDVLHRRDWPTDAIAAHLDTTADEIRRVRTNARGRKSRAARKASAA